MCNPGACNGRLCGDSNNPGSGCDGPGCQQCGFVGFGGIGVLDTEVFANEAWSPNLTHVIFGAILKEDCPATGLLAGDIVTKIDDDNMQHVSEFFNLRHRRPEKPAVLTVVRDGQYYTVTAGDPASFMALV
jgi:hypothetical protein